MGCFYSRGLEEVSSYSDHNGHYEDNKWYFALCLHFKQKSIVSYQTNRFVRNTGITIKWFHYCITSQIPVQHYSVDMNYGNLND